MDLTPYLDLPARPRITFELDLDDADRSERPAQPWESKLGGSPYRTAGASWPVGPDGEPMGFVAQFNLADVEAWRAEQGIAPVLDGGLPTQGILQFFVPLDHRWETAGVYLWPEVVTETDQLADREVAFRADEDAPVEFGPELTEPTRGGDDSGGTMLFMPRCGIRLLPALIEPVEQRPLFGDRDLTDEGADALDEAEAQGELPPGLGDPQESVQLGGYPDWVQGEERPDDSRDVLLFQLGHGGGGTMIGDSGTAYFMIDPEDLARRDFTHVHLYWNCC